MRDPHVRFRERHGGVIPRAYSTRACLGLCHRQGQGEDGAAAPWGLLRCAAGATLGKPN